MLNNETLRPHYFKAAVAVNSTPVLGHGELRVTTGRLCYSDIQAQLRESIDETYMGGFLPPLSNTFADDAAPPLAALPSYCPVVV